MPRAHSRAAVSVFLALVLAAGLVLAGLVVLRGRAEASHAAGCHAFSAEHATRLRHVSGSGRRIVVIGDSWSVGYKLTNPERGWPSRLPGRVRVDGFSGSGFSAHASPCGAVSYATRTRTTDGADLVVVEGGLNDYDQPYAAVRNGFRLLMSRLGGRDVVVFGPAPAPRRLAGARRVDGWLASLSKAAGVDYVSSIRLTRLSYLPDRLHLTPAGHRAYGDWVARHLPA
ncbi:SGNH/GDSL hydrolase family protein [Nocardioides sp. CER19]|uniref:SGNH/GDSL hydrolase family protein n=1 Tax=Nocardioides sp. CER19 TaxID=3038538 RepID=UPI00244CB2BC|nr:SGNH/GDSL hydrolase family protein [Nocardioides sp. CER19]MDH2414716.1 SGNH/GDSL hydrolase family protein [Nocardioides sp. CER19]